jgi:hypothetical protein
MKNNVEAACKNQRCHSERQRRISYFSLQIKNQKRDLSALQP